MWLGVASDLATEEEEADHGQGGIGTERAPKRSCNFFFALKFLASNPYALDIVQTPFAKPAPVKPLRGWGRGWVRSQTPEIPQTDPAETLFLQPTIQFVFVTHPSGHL